MIPKKIAVTPQVIEFLDFQNRWYNNERIVYGMNHYWTRLHTDEKDILLLVKDNPLQSDCLHPDFFQLYGWRDVYEGTTPEENPQKYRIYDAAFNDTSFFRLTWYTRSKLIRIRHVDLRNMKEIALMYHGPVSDDHFFYMLMKNLTPTVLTKINQ